MKFRLSDILGVDWKGVRISPSTELSLVNINTLLAKSNVFEPRASWLDPSWIEDMTSSHKREEITLAWLCALAVLLVGFVLLTVKVHFTNGRFIAQFFNIAALIAAASLIGHVVRSRRLQSTLDRKTLVSAALKPKEIKHAFAEFDRLKQQRVNVYLNLGDGTWLKLPNYLWDNPEFLLFVFGDSRFRQVKLRDHNIPSDDLYVDGEALKLSVPDGDESLQRAPNNPEIIRTSNEVSAHRKSSETVRPDDLEASGVSGTINNRNLRKFDLQQKLWVDLDDIGALIAHIHSLHPVDPVSDKRKIRKERSVRLKAFEYVFENDDFYKELVANKNPKSSNFLRHKKKIVEIFSDIALPPRSTLTASKKVPGGQLADDFLRQRDRTLETWLRELS